MKALVFNGPRDVRYEDFPDAELATPNSAIVKVEHCSICGSDLHIYHGDTVSTADYSAGVDRFCVGHEFIGEVVDVGSDVKGLRVGDKVLAAGGTGCGRCNDCVTGRSDACRKATAFGLSANLNGGQAEYANVPNADATLLPIPDGVNHEQALLLTDALATAFFGVRNADIGPGDTFAVIGLGPIGLLAVELALIGGASKVYAIDPVKTRRDRATALGATAMEPGKEAMGTIREETRGGANSVLEACGATPAIESALRLVRAQGTVSFIGLPQPDAALPLGSMLYRNVTVRAGVAPVTKLWESIVPLLQHGRLKAQDLFSHTMKLESGAEAYRMFDARDEGVVKIMIDV